MKKRILLLLSIIVLGGILSCDNPLSLLDTIQDIVMVANAKYLVVVEFSPSSGDLEVYPGKEITIGFDRLLQEDSILENIEIWNNTTDTKWILTADQIEFNTSLNLLTIKPKPFLDGLAEYTITIKPDFSGINGENLRVPLTWTFRTKNAPVGSMDFIAGVDAGYAGPTDKLIDLRITVPPITKYYYYSFDLADIEDIILLGESGAWNAIPATTPAPGGSYFDLNNIDMSGLTMSDGQSVPCYFVFADITANLTSEIIPISTIYDETAPVISINSNTIYQSTVLVAAENSIEITDDHFDSGFAYSWESSSGDLTFTPNNGKTTTVSHSSDGTDSYRVRVTDVVGNVGYSPYRTFVRDTVGPNVLPLLAYPVPVATNNILYFAFFQGWSWAYADPADVHHWDIEIQLNFVAWQSFDDYKLTIFTMPPLTNMWLTMIVHTYDYQGNESINLHNIILSPTP